MVEEKIYVIYIMANAWVEFVKQYAKKNDVSYSQAMKEAGSAYHSRKKRGKSTLRGKGLGDLPSEVIGKIGNNLDNKDLSSYSSTNEKINKDLKEVAFFDMVSLTNEARDAIQNKERATILKLIERFRELKKNPLLNQAERKHIDLEIIELNGERISIDNRKDLDQIFGKKKN